MGQVRRVRQVRRVGQVRQVGRVGQVRRVGRKRPAGLAARLWAAPAGPLRPMAQVARVDARREQEFGHLGRVILPVEHLEVFSNSPMSKFQCPMSNVQMSKCPNVQMIK